MCSPQTLVAGHLDIDTIVTDMGEASDVLGGSALYTSVAASLHDSPIGVISTICPDNVGSRFDEVARERLEPNVVHTLGSQRRNHMDYSTETSGESDRLSIGYQRKTWQEKCEVHAPRHRPSGYGEATEVIHLSPMLPRYQRLYAEWADERGLTISLDSSEYYTTHFAEELKDLLSLVDLLLLSEVEVRQIVPEVADDPYAAIRQLLAKGPSVVVVRQGEEGCLVADRDARYSFDALPTTVVDPTGAGDSFNGGFISMYPTSDLAESCACGLATAKHCVEEFGTKGLLNSSLEDIQRDENNVKWALLD